VGVLERPCPASPHLPLVHLPRGPSGRSYPLAGDPLGASRPDLRRAEDTALPAGRRGEPTVLSPVSVAPGDPSGRAVPEADVRPDTERSDLDQLLARSLETELTVIDVGARWGVGDRWDRYRPHVRVIGFEPDESECRRLNSLEGMDSVISFVPLALGSSTRRGTLHLTRDPACSSLYAPRAEVIRHRPELAPAEQTGQAPVSLTTLDAWMQASGLERVDVVKLDVQGAELDVLQGGMATLRFVRMLEVEVEFNEIYSGQPLFADVDRFLRQHGFSLWRLQHLVHYGLDDVPSDRMRTTDASYFDSRRRSFVAEGGQIYWGHAYFVRRELAFPTDEPVSWQVAVRDACSCNAFGFTDLALSILRRARAKAPRQAKSDLDALIR
jgi:FkbM family methyltransferase